MTALLVVLGWCLAAPLGALAVARFATLTNRRSDDLWAPAAEPTGTAVVPAPRAQMLQQQSEPASR